MLFNSLTFILLHALTLGAFWLTKNQQIRIALLLLTSVIFYGWLYWPALILLGIVILMNYGFSLWIDQTKSKKVLSLAIVSNLGNLAYFKYSNYLLERLQAGLDSLGMEVDVPEPGYWLPLGISFYSFQVIGYLIDVYRGEIRAEKSLLNFAVFKCFYAQLIAGPIVRAKELMPQLLERRTFNSSQFQKGFFLFISGLFIKICVADILAQYVDFSFNNPDQIETLKAWLSIYGFAFQILSDFWGYSTVAVGIGLMYGIKLPNNFNFPYIAKSCQDFWRRWHITLSHWFRDYLYIPLGGNKRGRMYLNLIITMSIAGIWHGAGINFLIWGFGHGIWLAIERYFGWQKMKGNSKVVGLLRQLLVFHLVCALWVFFRAETFEQASAFFSRMFIGPYDFNAPNFEILIVTIVLFLFFNGKLGRLFEGEAFNELSLRKQVTISSIIILLTIAYADAQLDFIYFVFLIEIKKEVFQTSPIVSVFRRTTP